MARYFTPSGTNIDQVGVDPDIEVEQQELTDAEEQAYIQLQEERRIVEFVERVGEPTDQELSRFISDLQNEGLEVNERYIRRLVRVEVNRRLNRDEAYDLEYDRVLQRAMEFLEQRRR
jgi:carboxyl-terminal processing protease